MASEIQASDVGRQASDVRRRTSVLAVLLFLVALTLRITNASFAFANGIPLLSPIDELYHWKRITFSAQHFPGVLEFDVDRGTHGAFCPWPPLYDLLAGGAARLLGARTELDVLRRIVWFPPLLGALFVALAVVIVARAFGIRAALACGIALAASPYAVTLSWIGSIDHHFFEWPLTFAILGATCFALRHTKPALAGILLGCSITIAMFVQTELLVPAALSFVVLFFLSDGKAAAIGFSIAVVAVGIYRLTRMPTYPDNEWFLGWTHVALFAGAAVASILRSRGRILALAAGITVIAAVPTALGSILEGMHFFGGETWLRTIAEFQPLWLARGKDLLSYAVGLGAGAIFVWPLAVRAIRRRDAIFGAIAVFAAVHLLLAISSRRFTNAGVPLLALAGAVWAASIVRPRWAMLALALVAVPPPIQFALWMQHPVTMIPSGIVPWVRTARILHDQPDRGRVLAPWSMGHVIDVLGGRPVIIDNFGTMSGVMTFDRAHEALLQIDEDALARYCRDNHVRYIVIDNPVGGLASVADVLGIDQGFFVRITGSFPPVKITRLALRTWWWKAYFGPGRSRHFVRIESDPQLIAQGTPFRGPEIEIWKLTDAFR